MFVFLSPSNLPCYIARPEEIGSSNQYNNNIARFTKQKINIVFFRNGLAFIWKSKLISVSSVALLMLPREIVACAERNDSDGRPAAGKGHSVHHGEDPTDGSVTATCWNENMIVLILHVTELLLCIQKRISGTTH